MEGFVPEPGLRVFDVSVAGTVLVRDLDLAKEVGQHVVVAIATQVAATGGALELQFSMLVESYGHVLDIGRMLKYYGDFVRGRGAKRSGGFSCDRNG